MATYEVHRVTALPTPLRENSFYFVGPAGSPNFVELYVVGNTVGAVRRVPTVSDINSLIAQAMIAAGQTQIVADIAARNALNPTTTVTVLVLNATGDATVASGAATYIWNTSTTSWIKISEAESMDIALTWASISGRPSSTPTQIDAAVANSHTHANLTQLGFIGEDAQQQLTYRGTNIRANLETGDW